MSTTLAAVNEALQKGGLTPRGAFHPEPEDGVPELSDGQQAMTLVLAGNAGPTMWTDEISFPVMSFSVSRPPDFRPTVIHWLGAFFPMPNSPWTMWWRGPRDPWVTFSWRCTGHTCRSSGVSGES